MTAQPQKIVVLTGAGMSAESGFATFRDSGGLWEKYPVEQVATPEGWQRDPDFVNEFYNGLRRQLVEAHPNRGHELLAELEQDYAVRIVTQNVDDLHERAGSSQVLHLHGELMKACSSRDPDNPFHLVTLRLRDEFRGYTRFIVTAVTGSTGNDKDFFQFRKIDARLNNRIFYKIRIIGMNRYDFTYVQPFRINGTET